MERKTTKMLALVAVIGLCAVALIGAAYAAFGGSASTYNEGNNAVAGNILIDNGDYDPMVDDVDIEFNTYTYQNGNVDGKAYYFAVAGSDVHSLTAKPVGDAKTLTVNNNTGDDISKLGIAIKSTGVISNADFIYFFKVTIAGSDDAFIDMNAAAQGGIVTGSTVIVLDTDGEAQNAQPLADGDDVEVTIQLYIGYTAGTYLPTNLIGAPGAQSATNTIPAKVSANGPINLDDIDFGFTVTDASNVI